MVIKLQEEDGFDLSLDSDKNRLGDEEWKQHDGDFSV